MRKSTAILAPLISVAALLAGCGQGPGVMFAPRPPVEPPTTYPGPSTYACGAWSPYRPSVTSATFDLSVTGPGAVEKIREAGGTIVHEFYVPKVRAYLLVEAVPGLANSGHVWSASQVPPDSAFDFEGVIMIPTPLSAEDSDFLESAGVTVIRQFIHSDAIYALIPDASVPTIRSHPDVGGIELMRFACIDGEARSDPGIALRGSPSRR